MTREVSQALTALYHFGLEKSRVSDALMDMAAKIDQGHLLPKSMEQAIITVEDDYQMTKVTLVFAERAVEAGS